MGSVYQYDHLIYGKYDKVRKKMGLTTLQADLLRWNTTGTTGRGASSVPHHQNFLNLAKISFAILSY